MNETALNVQVGFRLNGFCISDYIPSTYEGEKIYNFVLTEEVMAHSINLDSPIVEYILDLMERGYDGFEATAFYFDDSHNIIKMVSVTNALFTNYHETVQALMDMNFDEKLAD